MAKFAQPSCTKAALDGHLILTKAENMLSGAYTLQFIAAQSFEMLQLAGKTGSASSTSAETTKVAQAYAKVLRALAELDAAQSSMPDVPAAPPSGAPAPAASATAGAEHTGHAPNWQLVPTVPVRAGPQARAAAAAASGHSHALWSDRRTSRQHIVWQRLR